MHQVCNMPPSSLSLVIEDKETYGSTIIYWPCLILQFDPFVSHVIEPKDDTLFSVCSYLYMQCYGNDDHLASWLSADPCIQGDRSMNNSTSAIQHILAGYKLQFCLLAEMLLFLFLSVPMQVSCML